MSDTEEKDYHLDIHGKHFSRNGMLLLILVGTFGAMLMQTAIGTMIPTLMKDFDISMSTAQGATTWFLLANGVMVPISAYLATKFPTRWLYEAAYGLLIVGMLMCYMAPTSNWWVFLSGRILQAIAVGITMPLMQVALVNMFEPKRMGAVMGLGGIVIGVAPAIGPTFAGWLIVNKLHLFGMSFGGSWRTVFLIPMLVVALVFLVGLFVLHDVIPNRPMKLDFLSFILSILGFGVFLWGFTNVASDGWSDLAHVILPIIGGLIIITVFCWRQTTMKDPFLDIRVFKNKQFTLTTIAVALVTMAMMGVEMMLPLYLQEVHGLSAFNSGLTLLPGALMMMVVMPLAGAAYDRLGARPLTIVGFIILGIGTVPFIFLTTSTPNHFVTLLYGLRTVGIAMAMMPLMTSAMNALPVKDVAQGTASNSTARQIASSVVVALLSSVAQNVITNHMPATSLKTSNPMVYADKAINAMLTGYHASFMIGLAFAVVGLFVALFLRRGKVVSGIHEEDALAAEGEVK